MSGPDDDQYEAVIAQRVRELRQQVARPEDYTFGRPSDYSPEFCAIVIILGTMGYSRAEMANALDTTMETFDLWVKTHPDFLDAVARAKTASFAWWEAQGRNGLPHNKINAAMYAKCMSGRFAKSDYRDRPQPDPFGVGEREVDTGSAKGRLLERLRKMEAPTVEGVARQAKAAV